ncbi:CRISPR-associated endonuclease Cas1 [cf. Phormidesmis sp. LEGE 11477]|uniref:CRISPR-associated endonuclease Cas1 n=1 Tax=cf. Phormidesmis sp. LEGE 11477 TaxID=1828680 RepID=UPI00187E09D6|nr:CRISPR-associated endonuclease Cas1 [cf. Phormidesmis sp. LEGE 11477]MBE9063917.1 CRISPR-associated endonuclease Cas1 [cf. Phormidesmis sp. LEGE 11477]
MQVYAEHLYAAWGLVQRGSPAAGIDGITTELFAGVAEEQIARMHRQLRREVYGADPVKGFFVPKKKNGEQVGKRLIGLSTVKDRILQRYLLQSIYPRLEATFTDSAFAYRPGLSIYGAVDRVMERYAPQPTWVIKADIQQFFDNLSWGVLLGQLERLKIVPGQVRLIEQQLKAGMVLQGQFYRPNKGVVQGGILSGALANLYLSEFDRLCQEAEIPLVRYGDDCVAVCHSYLQANRFLMMMHGWLEDIYLTLNPKKTKIVGPDEGFTFLGHTFAQQQVIRPERTWSVKKKEKKLAKPVYGPPKACSIIKFPKRKIKRSTDEYWRDGMTTLYVTEQGAYLRVRHQQFQVFHERELRISIPANNITFVVIFGASNVSHGAVRLALQRRIPVLYLSNKGRYFGRLETTGQAKIDYLIHQVDRSRDESFVRRQAQNIIVGKLHNSRKLLMRLNRRRKTELATKAIKELAALMKKVRTVEPVESMLGYEGQGAHLYFQAYGSLLKGPFKFEKRTRRPPTDPTNSLLSLGYTLLSQNVHAMTEAAGLHTHFGNLHVTQPNRPSLVCDLVEEFRAMAVDSLVAYLLNSNIYKPDDFTPPDGRGGVYLHPDGLKRFLKHWEEKLQSQTVHPHTGYKVSLRRCFELQVWEYAAVISGEREDYRPMIWTK